MAEPGDEPTTEDGRISIAHSMRLVGAWLAFALMAIASLVLARQAPPTESLSHEEAARDFIQAWTQYRTGTFVVRGTTTRRNGGAESEFPYSLAQRPPDRTVHQYGGGKSTAGQADVMCLVDPENQSSCTEQPKATESYEDALNGEITSFLAYFYAADPPLYEVVSKGDGCYELLLRREMQLAPYGFSSLMCFDDETGALVELYQQGENGIEHMIVDSVSPNVTDSDLEVRVSPAPLTSK